MISNGKTIKTTFTAEQSTSEQKQFPSGVVPKKIKNIKNFLLQTDLFRDCKDCLQVIKNDDIYLVNYDLGDRIITHTSSKGQDLPAEEQFRLGAKAQAQAAKDILNIDGNPLFVVLKGYVEVHLTDELGLGNQLETIPVLTLNAGETFGDYEFTLSPESSTKSWRDYYADATAGWRTVHLNAPFSNKRVWGYLTHITGEKEPIREKLQYNNPITLARILYKSFYKLGCDFTTQIAVIPKHVITKIKNHGQFLKNLNNIKESHIYGTMPLHPLYGGSLFSPDKIVTYFVKYVVPKLMNGDLTVLVPCTEFPELYKWWREIHKQIITWKGGVRGKVQLRSLTLPYLFFVPSSGQQAIEKCKEARNKGYPAWGLSRAMIRSITHNYALSSGGDDKSLSDRNFIEKVNEALSNDDNLTFGNLEVRRESREAMLRDALSLITDITKENVQNYLNNKHAFGYKHGILFHLDLKQKEVSVSLGK